MIWRGLEAYTAYTVTNPDSLRQALATVRRTGLAICRREFDSQVAGVAVPVFGSTGEVLAALSARVRDLRYDLHATFIRSNPR